MLVPPYSLLLSFALLCKMWHHSSTTLAPSHQCDQSGCLLYVEARTPLTPQLPNSATQLQKSSIFAQFPCAPLRYTHENLYKNFGFPELGCGVKELGS